MLSRKMSAEQLQKAIKDRQRIPLIRTNFGPQEWVKGMRTLGINCRIVGDWEGRFPLPVFTTVIPLPRERVVPTVSYFAEDKTVDWHSPEATSEVLDQALNRKGLFARAITTMLDRPGEESEEGFRILNNALDHFRPESSIFKDDDFEKWWFKFALGITTQTFIKARAAFDHGEISPEARNLLETVEKQMEIFTGTLRSLSPRDLSSYLRFADLYAQLGKIMGPGHFQSFNGKLDTLGKLIIPKLEKAEREEIALRKDLHEKDLATWVQLKVGWDWEQVQDALATLPTLGSRFVIAHAIAALGANLSDLSPQGVADEIKLDPNNLVFLLGWNEKTLVEESKAKEEYPPILELSRKTVKLPGVLVLGEHLPIAAMILLDKAREIYSRDGFKKLIGDVHALVQLKQELTNPWLLTLLSLKDDPEIKDFIDELLGRWENLPEEVREILLNKKPGELTFSQQGKLRVKVKSVPPPPESLKVSPESPEKKRENKVIEACEVLILPFLGEVGLIVPKQIENFISAPGVSVSGDRLLNDFASLAGHWKDTFRRERHLLYLFHLNPQDKNFEEAKRLFGITAVYIEQDEFIFVLDKEKLFAQVDGRSLPVGFRGKLDETGRLHILGMDSSFLGEPKQLFLNILALRLTNQSFYVWGWNQKLDRERQRFVHEVIKGWNGSMRNSLPKIEIATRQDWVCLPITLAGCKEPLLACELPK